VEYRPARSGTHRIRRTPYEQRTLGASAAERSRGAAAFALDPAEPLLSAGVPNSALIARNAISPRPRAPPKSWVRAVQGSSTGVGLGRSESGQHAHRTSRPIGGKRAAEALRRHRARHRVAGRRARGARPRRDPVRERRFSDPGKARPGLAARAPIGSAPLGPDGCTYGTARTRRPTRAGVRRDSLPHGLDPPAAEQPFESAVRDDVARSIGFAGPAGSAATFSESAVHLDFG